MITGDASYIKKINRSLIIREIVKEGMISRADLSKLTALTRATISVQVSDLLEEELVVEKQLEHNSVGRRPIMLSINAKAGYTLGIDLDAGHISFLVTDLLGNSLSSATIHVESNSYNEILSLLTQQIAEYITKYSDNRYGIVGIVIAVHGLVSSNEEIHYIPRLGWSSVSLKTDLEKAVGIQIHIENNANLSSFAESVFWHHETDSLLSLTLYSGIGLGMIINNKFYRGHDGFAGEIGHMIVAPDGRPCECGNKGCWEKYASEASVLSTLAKQKKLPHVTYEQVRDWINSEDEEVLETMEQFINYLSIGINNIINIFNPETILVDSELLRIYPDSIDKIKQKLTSKTSHYKNLLISSIGEKSTILGACALAIQYFLDVPVLNLSHNFEKSSTEPTKK
ncbi:ROK family protein [Paenibacillus kribbensis]|uniref:ROK family protein n=1 Tax=Paenibacillus kribbensis TaxID=172713 RepID=A0A222WRL5_9BACL|nr:ROK family protein [Paenibacillus kribbensis]ASR49237.1 ROK family protein [Paenibacillus kribbensis]